MQSRIKKQPHTFKLDEYILPTQQRHIAMEYRPPQSPIEMFGAGFGFAQLSVSCCVCVWEIALPSLYIY